MRKLIIIGLLATAVWLAGMPGLVGFYLREAVPEWLQESQRSVEIEYSPGWFNSRANYRPDPSIILSLAARHFPPLKPGWVALDGELTSPFTPEGAEIRAHLGLTGSWHLSVHAGTFKTNPEASTVARELTLNVAQIPGQPASMTVSAAELELPNQPEPLLDVRVRGIKRQSSENTVRLGLDVHARDAQLGNAQLTLQAGPLLPEHLETLMQALNQLTASESGSVSENLALLGMASVWQQMAINGLTIELETLRFGEATSFEGSWATAQAEPLLSGTGDIQTLDRWLNRLVGSGANGPNSLSVDTENLLSEFGQVDIHEGRFRFRTPARSGRQAPSDLRPAP